MFIKLLLLSFLYYCLSQNVACCIHVADPAQCADLPVQVCIGSEGDPGIPGSVCTGAQCGACCHGTTVPFCDDRSVDPYTCRSYGRYGGDGSTCDNFNCTLGGCCLPGQICTNITQEVCSAGNGVFQGFGSRCESSTCAEAEGACCFPNATCAVVTLDTCYAGGGSYQGNNTVCVPEMCNPTCVETTPQNCSMLGGTFKSFFETCNASTCVTGLIKPILDCVINNGNGTCYAFLGYNNTYFEELGLSCEGDFNYFSPGDKCRGQTEDFLPGYHPKVFVVDWNCGPLTWNLDDTSLVIGNVTTCTGACCLQAKRRYTTYNRY